MLIAWIFKKVTIYTDTCESYRQIIIALGESERKAGRAHRNLFNPVISGGKIKYVLESVPVPFQFSCSDSPSTRIPVTMPLKRQLNLALMLNGFVVHRSQGCYARPLSDHIDFR